MSLPSLNALRAFEAAARLLSFKDAAEELKITPSAVSRHIRSLELALGVRAVRARLPASSPDREGGALRQAPVRGFQGHPGFDRRGRRLRTGAPAQAEARDALHQRHVHEPLARGSPARFRAEHPECELEVSIHDDHGQGRQPARRSSHPVHGRRHRRPGAHPARLADHHSRLRAVAD